MKKIICRSILCILFLFMFTSSLSFGAVERDFSIHDGVLSLENTNFSEKLVPLKGEWEFYWDELLQPKDFNQPKKPQYIEVPNTWANATYTGNEKLSNEGFGTYRLLIKIDEKDVNQVFSLYLPSVASAFQIWVDGKRISGNGTVGIDRKSMKPKSFSQVTSFQPTSNEIELIMQISNFSQRKGGMWSPIKFGYEKTIMKHRELNIVREIMTAGCILALGFYHISLYLFRVTTLLPLFLGIFCLFVSLRTLLVGDILFMYLFPQFPWELSVKLEYLTFSIGLMVVFVFLMHLFPKEMNRNVVYIAVAICIFFSLTTLFPAYIYTHFLTTFEVLIAPMLIYSMYVVTIAAMRKREGSYINFWSIIFLVLAVINDMLFHKQWIETIDLAPIAASIFLFVQTLVVAKKSSNAFKSVESLSLELLEANASLEQKVAERTTDLQNINSQLRHIEESRKSFFSTVAHEIGTPMQSIQGYIQLIQSQIKSEETSQYLNVVYEKTKLLNHLSKDLLYLAKLDEGQLEFNFEYINVHFFLDHINKQLQHDIENERIHFIQSPLDLRESEVSLYAWLDPMRIEQVLVNLVQNAIKFTQAGGTIEIGGSYVPSEEGSQNGSLHIKVKDNGQGIQADLLPHIFKRFVKAKPLPHARKGMGLGLSICTEIVKKHQGSIEVESEVGKGSTFTVILPAHIRKEETEIEQKNYDC